MNITSARGTVHCRKTRISSGDHLVICGQYSAVLTTRMKFGSTKNKIIGVDETETEQ
jgi:hypothetical protein